MGKGQGVTPTVFISYSHANVQRVRTIAQRLRGWGYAVWLDEVALDPGDDWRARIEEAIPSADFLLLALTRSSVRSEMVEWELGLAAKTGVPVIPLDFGTGRITTRVSDRLEHLHHISFKGDAERGMAALVEVLGGIRNDMPVLDGEDQFPEIRENAAMIAEIVRFLQELSHTGGGAIFTGGNAMEYYIQFYVAASDEEIYSEAVGNGNLEGEALLDAEQLTALEALGWRAPTKKSFGNFSRTWYANSPRSRALIAGDVMRAFLEVYRHPPAERLKLELQVQD